MQKQRRRGFTAWEHLLRFLIDLTHNGWIRLIAKVTSAVLVALAIVVMTLIIGFSYSGLQVRGILLTQIMQETVQDSQLSLKDPFIVLQKNNLQPNDLIPVSDKKEIVSPREGWLTFIVNDAVLSEVEGVQSKDCKDYHDALQQASNILNQQGNQQGDKYQIPNRLIPLIWYSDNIGAFHVTVRYTNK
jgi:hypothetical protein